VLKIAQFLLSVSPRLFFIWLAVQTAFQGVLGAAGALESARVYGRFMGGSASNSDSLVRGGQSRQFMQIAQWRINTGDFASC
jgi:hypothetical protein